MLLLATARAGFRGGPRSATAWITSRGNHHGSPSAGLEVPLEYRTAVTVDVPAPGGTGQPPDPGSGIGAGICLFGLKFWIHPALPVLF